MRILGYGVIVFSICLAMIKRDSIWPRVVAIVVLLGFSLMAGVGVQASSRLALEKNPESGGELRAAWQAGALATRQIAEGMLPLGAACVLGLAVLAVVPRRR